jgi:translation initiation factor 2B subunit (eIF-2B alpha/beta/delta family)
MKNVHVSAKVEHQIEALKNDGKAGRAVARRAAAIIENLTAKGVGSYLDDVGSYTRYGEKRIRNCRKYDLSCGYRLVTLQRGVKLFVLFLGTHDACQRWLKNHRRLKEVIAGNGEEFQILSESPLPANQADTDAADSSVDDEEELQLSDQEMRRVFCGLVEAARKRSQKAKEHLKQPT